MRDINRIEPICNELAELWKKQPDMRFSQFLMNIISEVANNHGDPWFYEDNKFMECVKEIPWLK